MPRISLLLIFIMAGGTAGLADPVSFPLGSDSPLTEQTLLNLKPAEVKAVKGGEKRLDAWWETYLNYGTAEKGGTIRNTPHWSKGWQALKKEMPFANDPSRNRIGDFSVVFEAARAEKNVHAVGVHPGPFLQPWKLGADWSLEVWLKGEGMASPPLLALIDREGKRASGELTGFVVDGQWHEVKVPLKTLKAETGFDFSAVRAVQFEQDWQVTARLSMDGVRFTKETMEIGVSDKSLEQRMDESRRTRLLRMHESIVSSPELLGTTGRNKKGNSLYMSEFSLWPRKGLNLEEANRSIEKVLSEQLKKLKENENAAEWAGIANPVELGLYWAFCSRSPIFPGRLSPKNEELLLEHLWYSSKTPSDIHCARMPSLWVFSSENHDGAWRLKALLSTAIFKDLPDYNKRPYPDFGFGPGFPGYGYPPADVEELRSYFPHKGEFGPLADGKRYTAPAHYEAWKDLWTRYFNDRAQVNFWLEQGGGYRGALLRNVYSVYLFGRDTELTKRAGMFLDLFWLKYAQNSLAGYEGGPKHRQFLGDYVDGQHDPFFTFQMGGPATGQSISYWRHPAPEMMLSNYELPRIVWRMMLDKKGMGSFVFESRALGEENDILPRPEGTQNMFLLNGQQRMSYYCYNTPYYMLSTSLDSPNMLYTHLNRSGLFQGLTAPWGDALLIPIAPTDDKTTPKASIPEPIHGVQDKNVFVGFYDPLTRARSPAWFPAWDRRPFIPDKEGDPEREVGHGIKMLSCRKGAELMVKGWDEVVEEAGWVFVKDGCVYAAARIVVPAYDEMKRLCLDAGSPGKVILQTQDCYYWDTSHTVFGNTSSDVMIIEAGTEEEFGSFAEFRKAIQKNRLEVWMARLAPILVYRGSRKDAKVITLNLMQPYLPPELDGKAIRYELPWTVKTPYMESAYKSGVIRAEYSGEKLHLDFGKLQRTAR